jgi:hypothetical protein
MLGFLLSTPLFLLALWGASDLYMLYRFRRNPEVDKTASVFIWIGLKWGFASQTRRTAEKLPFISQDLSEMLGIKDDDGDVT